MKVVEEKSPSRRKLKPASHIKNGRNISRICLSSRQQNMTTTSVQRKKTPTTSILDMTPKCNGYRRRKWIQVQILDETDCISHSTNTLGKSMNRIIFPPAGVNSRA